METINQILELTQTIITISAILIGGFWTYFKFIKQREAYPKIMFGLDINVIGSTEEKWIIELAAIIENQGLVRHKINTETFIFSLRYLNENDKIENQVITGTNNKTHQVFFKNKLKLRDDESNNKWLSDDWKYTYIEPNTKQKYSHIISVDKEVKFLLLHSRFKYADKKLDFHSAEKIIEIKKQNST